MAEHRGKVPVGKGIPSEHELLKPLIFPNSQRSFKFFSTALTVGITIYFVFFHEFPQSDHCFMPIRQLIEAQKAHFFRIRPDDEEYIDRRKQELREAKSSETDT